MNIDRSKVIPHVISIGFILAINFLFFLPQFQGKSIKQGDMIQANGAMKELTDYAKTHDDPPLWSSMFSGMPAYQISLHNNKFVWGYASRAFRLGISDPAGSFVMGMLLFYFVLVLIGFHPYLALLGSLGFGFSTNNFILYEAGHLTKLWTVISIPLVLGGAYLITKKRYLLGAALFSTGLGLNIASGHPQMTYYFGMAFIPFVFIELYKSIKNKEFLHLGKSLGILACGVILAVMANAPSILTTYEYAKDTMRGKPILTANSAGEATTSQKTGDGLEWNYSMGWSNGVKDVFASLIPDFVGGGSGRWLDGKSELGKKIGSRKDFQAPTYWGDLPFTSGPIYFGASLIFLFLLGSFVVKDSSKWWAAGAVLITIVISMGKNMEIINRLFFDYFPMFNKFRSPNSVLSLTSIFISFLAIRGLNTIAEDNQKSRFIKPLLISASILGGFCLLMALIGTSLFSFSGSGDENYANIIDALVEQRRSLFLSSSLRSFLFIAMSAGLVYLLIKEKVKPVLTYLLLTLVVLIDLYSVGKTYMPSSAFVKASQVENTAKPRTVDEQILSDKSLGYRVYDGTVDPFQSALPSYFHRSVGGYHAAKLQRYQDLIVNHLSKGNQRVFDMLNTKYFILNGQDNQPRVQENPGALGAAWFVQKTNIVESPDAEIAALNTIDPKNTAVVLKEFAPYVQNLDTSASGQIAMTSFGPNLVEYASKSDKEALAVFSEIWYGPNKGWQAYIDGKAVDHIRVNYVLRAMKIPAGDHKIKFEFKPITYYASVNVGMITTILLLLFFGFAVWREVKGKVSA